MIQLLLCLSIFINLINGSPTSSSIEPIPTPSYLVDILSSQPQFSYFLRHLQRNRMIPQLNLLENVTLLAPINSAFVESQGQNENILSNENQLLRYVVNQTLVVENISDTLVIYDTLYKPNGESYPIKFQVKDDDYIVDDISSIVEPDLLAKHQRSYVQGIDHLLPIKPSICEVLLNSENSEISIIGDLFRSLFPDEVVIERRKRKKKKKKKNKPKLLPKTCSEFLAGVKTLIVPSDEVLLDSLTELQLKYYLANLADERYKTTDDAIDEIDRDIILLLKELMFDQYIGGVNGTTRKLKSTTGKKYHFESKHGNLSIGNFTSNTSHVLSNGIIQVFKTGDQFFQNLNIPTVEMIARKSLYAAHYSNFVKELKFRSLEGLIDGSISNQTILIDVDSRDDVSEDEIYTSSYSLKQELMYHFIDETVDLYNSSYVLKDSNLCLKKKLGGCYKIKLSKSKSKGHLSVSINDGNEVLERILINNGSQILIINEELSPPVNLKHSLGDLMSTGAIPRPIDNIQLDRIQCLKTLNYLNDFDLYSLKDNDKGYTIFLPCGTKRSKYQKGLWDELGLVLDYLESKPELLKDIMKGMFLEKTIYTNYNESGSFNSLTGAKTEITGSILNDHYNNIKINNDVSFNLPLNSDVLFNQGVIHVINEVLLPKNFHIPIEELIKTTNDPNFSSYSITNLLKMYPKIQNSLFGKHPYSLIIPQPESLKNFNITPSFEELFEFLEFHLIPNEEVGKLLDCVYGYDTNEEIIRTNYTKGGLTCRHKSDKTILLALYKFNNTDEVEVFGYNKDQEVKLLSHGCTSPYYDDVKNISCVFLVDKPLNLDWFKDHKDDNFLHIHLGIVSVGFGVILGLIMVGGVMVGLIFCIGGKKKSNHHHPYLTKINDDDDSLPRIDSGFMSVLTDEDDYLPYDRGYETDVDVLRTETDALLPYHMKRKKKLRPNNFGSIKVDNNGNTLPRDIGNFKKNLTRERNLPGVSQF
ncbi:uncharacterized protein KGF55_004385 [Candida pseudojiufengensis]|uniref:uncharacterized protein n=1 Tax=Candida pseudojiufengensis TaxID=497109 RepID=UPI00222582E2|nr:uncharacterized protein KGF55_004385 [Candida pseudojiufengensis]KAI5960815.1 hypothetical protein KGF55_004385 [Candida pseudojiufengensis]